MNGKRRELPGRGRPLRFHEVVFITISLFLIGAYFLGGSVNDYMQMRQFDDWWSRGAGANEMFTRRVQIAFNGPRATTAAHKLDAEANDAAIVRLDIPKDQWAALQRDKQETWGVWLDAGLVRGDLPSPIRIRRRGDTSLHWTTEKMSFTVRTPNADRFRGFRTLAFSMADVLPQYVALALAQDFDLLAPYTTVAPVFVNGRYYGIYQVTETIDDDFLTRHDQLPGVIYQGDAAERGDAYPGVPRGLFMNPYIWEFAAGDDDGAPADRKPLIEFISDLNDHTFEAHLRLMERLDREEIARFVALLLIAGDPYHMDNLHNQFWYADPASGKLHPVPWDLRLLDISKPPTWVNEFLRAVLRDPFMVDAVLREVNRRVEDGVVERAGELAQGTYARFRDHFEYDRLRAAAISDVGTPKDVLTPLTRNARVLRNWARDSRIAAHAGRLDGAIVVDLETQGYAGADLTAIETTVPAGAMQAARMFADRNRNGVLDSTDPLVAGRWENGAKGARYVLANPEALLPGWDTRGKGIGAGAVHYRYFLTGAGAGAVTVTPIARNRVTREAATIARWTRASRTPTNSWSPWQYAAQRGTTVRWSGNVELRETVILSSRDTLVIEPGTTVRMHPEVSVVSRGFMRANGRADAPIRFTAAVSGLPWGAIAMQGAGAAGSTLRHVEFDGGGGATVSGVTYTGMMNVHHTSNVILEDVVLRNNIRSDDALRFAHAGGVVRRCSFANTNADAVAFEYSDGEISECRFGAVGDDAIEVKGSALRIVSNQITSAGNRGMAIDMLSKPFVFNNVITGAAVGIDVRGGAEPLLISNRIASNRIGLQQRDARGMGGWAKSIANILENNESDEEIDQTSRMTEPPSSRNTLVALRDAMLGANRAGSPAARTPGLTQVDAQEFEEDFASVTDGWTPVGGSLRLEKRGAALSSTLEKKRGGMQRRVDWNVGTDTALLVLEVSGRYVRDVSVTVATAAGEVTRPVTLVPTPGRYTYVLIRLPRGSYKQLRLEGMPERSGWEIDPLTGFRELRRSRLELASYQLLSRNELVARR